MLFTTLRVVVAAGATLILLAGLAVIAIGGLPGLNGLWLVGTGAVGLVAVALERTRYRSEEAERRGQEPGFADRRGSSTALLGPRRRFVDPPTAVGSAWIDPASGERR